MPYFKWVGHTKESVDRRVQSMLNAICTANRPDKPLGYPEMRGKPKIFTDVNDDSPATARAKEAKRKEYLAFREKELREHLAKSDALGVFGPDGSAAQVKCKKNDKVFVSPKAPHLAKLLDLALSDGPGGWKCENADNWEVVVREKDKRRVARCKDPSKEPAAPKQKPVEPEPKPADKPVAEDAPGRLGKGK